MYVDAPLYGFWRGALVIRCCAGTPLAVYLRSLAANYQEQAKNCDCVFCHCINESLLLIQDQAMELKCNVSEQDF